MAGGFYPVRASKALTCVNMDVMADRYRAPGGWTVDVIHLSSTTDHRDGEWLRVSLHGSHVADVRTVAELEPDGPLVLVA